MMTHLPFAASRARAALAVTLLASASPLAAGAQPTPAAAVPVPVRMPVPPIQITSCEVLQYHAVVPGPFWYPFGPVLAADAPYTDGIRIRFTNRSPLTADRVVFRVNYRGDIERIVDIGTFSPNAPIDHTFGNFSGLAFLGPNPNECIVLAARFTNGTVFRAVTP